MKYLKTHEIFSKHDNYEFKYSVGDLVKRRPKKQYEPINTSDIYTIIKQDTRYIHLFNRPRNYSIYGDHKENNIRKNVYDLQNNKTGYIHTGILEKDIRKASVKEIEKFEFEKDMNKYNI